MEASDSPSRQATAGIPPDDNRVRFELAARAAELGIWDWDLEANTVVYSPRARDICGLRHSGEPLRREEIRRLTHAEDVPRVQAMIERALDPAIRERLPYEYRVVRGDGTVRWVRAYGEVVYAAVEGGERAVRYIGTLQDITDEHRLREALEASEARLRLAIGAGRMAVWEADLRNDTVAGSSELNRLLGFSEDATPTVEEIRAGYPPGERERVRGYAFDAVARGERFIETEFRYVWPNGESRWLLLRAEVHFEEGQAARAVGVLMDHTERRRAEESLRASEARIKLAQKVAGIGVWEWDLAGGAISWSPEMYTLLGIAPPVDDLYAAWLERLHPDDRAMADAQVRSTARDGRPLALEVRIVRDGEVRWIRSRGTAIAGDDGRPVRLIGINHDVTDLRRRQQALEDRNRALREVANRSRRERERVFELSQELFAAAGFDGYLKVINPAWVRLLGYEQGSLLAQPFTKLVHPDDQPLVTGAIAAMQQGDVVQRFEHRLRRADGGWHWIAWTAVPEGEFFYAVGRDVTHEKRAAQELEAANRQLRTQIESRERAEATLRQMQRLEAVGQLTSGVAHDFNNLLTIVLGNLDLIEDAVSDPKVCRRVELVRQAALRGATLTSQLLAFSRRQRLEPKVVDLNETVAGMSELLRSTMGGAIAVSARLQPRLWCALVDPTQIELVILNLAINARDAMPVGGSLVIGTANATLQGEPQQPGEPGPGDYVAISVTDTGTGMEEAIRARAFEPFFTTKDVGKGSGLGLAQVLGFAQQSGGGVRIQSAPGAGTTVCVYLPRARAGATTEEPSGRAGGDAPPYRERRLALLVDDDTAVRDVTAARLRRLGFDVLEAGSGGAALDLLERTPCVDLLVADFAMPGMNGAKVVEQARIRRPDLPVLFVTGYADQAALADAGDERVVQKPFRDDELERKVRAVMEG